LNRSLRSGSQQDLLVSNQRALSVSGNSCLGRRENLDFRELRIKYFAARSLGNSWNTRNPNLGGLRSIQKGAYSGSLGRLSPNHGHAESNPNPSAARSDGRIKSRFMAANSGPHGASHIGSDGIYPR